MLEKIKGWSSDLSAVGVWSCSSVQMVTAGSYDSTHFKPSFALFHIHSCQHFCSVSGAIQFKCNMLCNVCAQLAFLFRFMQCYTSQRITLLHFYSCALLPMCSSAAAPLSSYFSSHYLFCVWVKMLWPFQIIKSSCLPVFMAFHFPHTILFPSCWRLCDKLQWGMSKFIFLLNRL